jgi:hypothetical protein
MPAGKVTAALAGAARNQDSSILLELWVHQSDRSGHCQIGYKTRPVIPPKDTSVTGGVNLIGFVLILGAKDITS